MVLNGMTAYSHHAYVLGYKDEAIFEFIEKGLVEKFNIKPHTTVEEDMKVLLNQA